MVILVGGVGADQTPATQRPSERLRILQVAGWWGGPEPGGVVAVMKDLMAALAARHDVSLLVRDWAAARPVEGHDGTRPYVRMRLPGPPVQPWRPRPLASFLVRFPAAVLRLLRYCQRQNTDVVHLHYLNAYHLPVAAARRLGGPPYVVTLHGSDIRHLTCETVVSRWAKRCVLNNAAGVLTVSTSLESRVRALLPALTNLSTVHNGVMLPETSGPGEVNALPWLRLPDRYAAMVANFRPGKGHDVVLDAWEILVRRGAALPLVLVGGGPDLDRMRARADALELSVDHVQFVGWQSRDTARAVMAGARLCVAASRFEGQGLAVLEAGAVGVPVVCSDIDAFAAVIRHGETGLRFPVDDAGALADAVGVTAADPEAAGRRAKRLRADVHQHYSLEAMCAGYERAYAAALGNTSYTARRRGLATLASGPDEKLSGS